MELPNEFKDWLVTHRVPPSFSVDATARASLLEFPMGQLFLGLVHCKEREWDAAAVLIDKAVSSKNLQVMACPAGSELIEIFKTEMPPPTKPTDIADVLQRYLQQSDAGDSAPLTKKAKTGAVTSNRTKIERAAGMLRQLLLQDLTRKGIAWASASPQVRIQKLLFYADALWMATTKQALFDTPPTAFRDGPVYDHARSFLKGLQARGSRANEPPPHEGSLSEREEDCIRRVFECLGATDTQTLIDLTHQEEPWVQAKNKAQAQGRSEYPIEHCDLIRWFSDPANSPTVASILPRTQQAGQCAGSSGTAGGR